MNMFHKLFLGILLCITAFAFAIGNVYAENGILSEAYPTLELCTSTKDFYNIEYPSYTRSNCFEKDGKFYYYICELGTTCRGAGETQNPGDDQTGGDDNPTVQSYAREMDAFIIALRKARSRFSSDDKYRTFLEATIIKLEQLRAKHINNPRTLPLIDALIQGAVEVKNDFDLIKNAGDGGSQTCNGTKPSGAGVIFNTGPTVSPPPPPSSTWVYDTNRSWLTCSWKCDTGYERNGNLNSCKIKSNSGDGGNTGTGSNSGSEGGDNGASGTCTGVEPTGLGVIKRFTRGVPPSPMRPLTQTDWLYQNGASQNHCTWYCDEGYRRNGNSCVTTDSGVYDPSATSIRVEGSSLTRCELGSIRRNIYNLPIGVEVKVCEEYKNRPSGSDYTCDTDNKFQTFAQAGWNHGPNTSPNKTTIMLNNLQTPYLPGEYRTVVMFPNGEKIYSNWITLSNSGPGSDAKYNDPNKCAPILYQFDGVADILWEWLNNKNFSPRNIDYPYLEPRLPAACSLQYFKNQYFLFNLTVGGYENRYRAPSAGGRGGIFDGGAGFLVSCMNLPTWAGPTYRDPFGSNWPGQKDNIAQFDFQAWYSNQKLGTNYFPWTLGGPACGMTPLHDTSQVYGGIKWESGKTFDCGAGTYGGVPVGNSSSGGGNTPPTNTGDGGNQTCNGTKPSGVGVIFNTGPTVSPPPPPSSTWVYDTNRSWLTCSWKCDTGYERNGDSNSCKPKTNTPPTTEFTIHVSKTKLRHTGDRIAVTITGLDYETAKVCNRIAVHPNVPAAVDPEFCKRNADFVYLKDLSGWTYTNGVWSGGMDSTPTLLPIGLKWSTYFMMGTDLTKRKWTPQLEVIQ